MKKKELLRPKSQAPSSKFQVGYFAPWSFFFFLPHLIRSIVHRAFTVPFTLILFFNPTFSQNTDIDLLHNINKNSSAFGDKVFPVITESATPVTLAVPLSLFITGLAKKNDTMKKKSYQVVASLLIANMIAGGLKYSINRPRPFKTYPFIEKKSSGGSPSFPSGHTTTAFATATSLSLAYPKWYVIAPAYLWACSVGYSRMYLGVHYPSDVLAGIIIGSGFSYLSFKGRQWLEKRKKQKAMTIESRIKS